MRFCKVPFPVPLILGCIALAGLIRCASASEETAYPIESSTANADAYFLEISPPQDSAEQYPSISKVMLAQADAKKEPSASDKNQSDSSVAGSVKSSKGEVAILRDGKSIPSSQGERLLVGDVLKTEKDGSVGIILRDDTVISLGPSSELEMKEFQFEPKEEEYSFVTRMVKGTFVYVSGLIGRLSPESVKMETPVGIIAVRGTKLLVRIKG